MLCQLTISSFLSVTGTLYLKCFFEKLWKGLGSLSYTDHLFYSVINVGTSSQFTFLMPEGFIPSADNIDKSSPVEYVPFYAGRYLSETASLNGGNVLAAFVNMLRDWLREFGIIPYINLLNIIIKNYQHF